MLAATSGTSAGRVQALSTLERLPQVKVTSGLPCAVDVLEGLLLSKLSHCRSRLIEHSSVVLAGVLGQHPAERLRGALRGGSQLEA